ncbi:uncharacterized protein BYT42DRAFT_643538 [Radiomyces spectabilis]|uniref:uncharacterized protein n=1 Tax=Radiomyces spectabilis TaxID=64574 RepID=UPI00221E8BA9|nr:uncharacterized protein BYT42DRAFT_643538 [Radiomyces spectabilis]KAI8384777.1 hypothetical protein BYT42DRAFT_643538 [Radiomyces spectabilis]
MASPDPKEPSRVQHRSIMSTQATNFARGKYPSRRWSVVTVTATTTYRPMATPPFIASFANEDLIMDAPGFAFSTQPRRLTESTSSQALQSQAVVLPSITAHSSDSAMEQPNDTMTVPPPVGSIVGGSLAGLSLLLGLILLIRQRQRHRRNAKIESGSLNGHDQGSWTSLNSGTDSLTSSPPALPTKKSRRLTADDILNDSAKTSEKPKRMSLDTTMSLSEKEVQTDESEQPSNEPSSPNSHHIQPYKAQLAMNTSSNAIDSGLIEPLCVYDSMLSIADKIQPSINEEDEEEEDEKPEENEVQDTNAPSDDDSNEETLENHGEKEKSEKSNDKELRNGNEEAGSLDKQNQKSRQKAGKKVQWQDIVQGKSTEDEQESLDYDHVSLTITECSCQDSNNSSPITLKAQKQKSDASKEEV